jgi:hypothetical protein
VLLVVAVVVARKVHAAVVVAQVVFVITQHIQ